MNTHVLLDNSILGQPYTSPDAEASATYPGGEHETTELVHLWDPDLGPVEAGINHADDSRRGHMPNLVVIHTTGHPDHLRGALSRWLTEPAPGLYVGSISARVRDHLWQHVTNAVGDGAAVCVHPDDNEQRCTVKTASQRRRQFDGLQLITFTNPEQHQDHENVQTPSKTPGQEGCSPRTWR